LVPAAAKRTASLVGRKCRAEYAEVVSIENNSENNSGEAIQSVASNYDAHVVYRVGATIYPDRYDDDPRVECTHGIHFYLTRQEAEGN
jgi:hypothetical protein